MLDSGGVHLADVWTPQNRALALASQTWENLYEAIRNQDVLRPPCSGCFVCGGTALVVQVQGVREGGVDAALMTMTVVDSPSTLSTCLGHLSMAIVIVIHSLHVGNWVNASTTNGNGIPA